MARERAGLIGFGSIGKVIARGWDTLDEPKPQLAAVCVRPNQLSEAKIMLGPDVHIVTSAEDLMELQLSLVIEAAGQRAARSHAVPILSRGCDLYLLSTGVLADADYYNEIISAAKSSGARICIPAGAMAGFDGLLALRMRGLRSVTYVSTKPPYAWQGTPAEQLVDFRELTNSTVLFEGSAREAAKLYPQNANLAAAIAEAGIGPDETKVLLIADPNVDENIGLLVAEGSAARMSIEVRGAAAEENPKTSAIVGMSVLSSIQNRYAALTFV